jgi:hypothetical protein
LIINYLYFLSLYSTVWFILKLYLLGWNWLLRLMMTLVLDCLGLLIMSWLMLLLLIQLHR